MNLRYHPVFSELIDKDSCALPHAMQSVASAHCLFVFPFLNNQPGILYGDDGIALSRADSAWHLSSYDTITEISALSLSRRQGRLR
jgi:hypothetical protein